MAQRQAQRKNRSRAILTQGSDTKPNGASEAIQWGTFRRQIPGRYAGGAAQAAQRLSATEATGNGSTRFAGHLVRHRLAPTGRDQLELQRRNARKANRI